MQIYNWLALIILGFWTLTSNPSFLLALTLALQTLVPRNFICGLKISRTDITQELVRNAEAQTDALTHWIRICISTISPSDLHAEWSLWSAALGSPPCPAPQWHVTFTLILLSGFPCPTPEPLAAAQCRWHLHSLLPSPSGSKPREWKFNNKWNKIWLPFIEHSLRARLYA